MEPWLQSLLSTIAGGAIAIGAQYIQTRQQARRDRWRLAVETAVQYHGQTVDVAKHVASQNPGQKVSIIPLNAIILGQLRLLELIERGSVTKADLEQLAREVDDLGKASLVGELRKP